MDYSSTPANELAELCSHAGEHAAWREFVHRFQRPIALVVKRTAAAWGEPSTALVDDLVQETFLRLCADRCRLLRGFVPRAPDSIYGYLRDIAANTTHDHFRAKQTLKRGGDLRRVESESDETGNLPAAIRQQEAIDTSLQIEEIDQMLQSFEPDILPERDRAIFWLYYRQGFTAREISEMSAFNLSLKGVESALNRTLNLVRQAVQPKGV